MSLRLSTVLLLAGGLVAGGLVAAEPAVGPTTGFAPLPWSEDVEPDQLGSLERIGAVAAADEVVAPPAATDAAPQVLFAAPVQPEAAAQRGSDLTTAALAHGKTWHSDGARSAATATGMRFELPAHDWHGGGVNWAGWYDPSAAINVSGRRSVAISLTVGGTPGPGEVITLSLVSRPAGSSHAVDPLKAGLIPAWTPGQRQTLLIPLSEFTHEAKGFDPQAVWQIDVGHWGPTALAIELHEVAFTDRAPPDLRYLGIAWEAPRPVAIAVHADRPGHAIPPAIYGTTFVPAEKCSAWGISGLRLGGNQGSPYNWRLGCSNQGNDWYFRNVSDMTGRPEWVAREQRAGRVPQVTIPLLPWLAADGDHSHGGYPLAQYPAQAQHCPSDPELGNGFAADGSGERLLCTDPSRFAVANSPQNQRDFVTATVAAGATGAWWLMDNEPTLWPLTHTALAPTPWGYDDYWALYRSYGEAILAADPAGHLAGPALDGWSSFAFSAADQWRLDQARGRLVARTPTVQGKPGGWWRKPEDRLAHGNTPFIEWFLTTAAAHERSTGKRLLHALDVHWYPQRQVGSASIYAPGAVQRSREVVEARLQSTRDLWDVSATRATPGLGSTWIKEQQAMLPRLHALLAKLYPGTRLALNEYDWAGDRDISGALAQVELLGIFAWQGVDIASKWGGLPGTQALGWRLVRAYDGTHAFGDTWLSCGSSDRTAVSVFAARRSSDGAVTVLLVNKSAAAPADVALDLPGLDPRKARIFTVSEHDLDNPVAHQGGLVAGRPLRLPPFCAALLEFPQ